MGTLRLRPLSLQDVCGWTNRGEGRRGRKPLDRAEPSHQQPIGRLQSPTGSEVTGQQTSTSCFQLVHYFLLTFDLLPRISDVFTFLLSLVDNASLLFFITFGEDTNQSINQSINSVIVVQSCVLLILFQIGPCRPIRDSRLQSWSQFTCSWDSSSSTLGGDMSGVIGFIRSLHPDKNTTIIIAVFLRFLM